MARQLDTTQSVSMPVALLPMTASPPPDLPATQSLICVFCISTWTKTVPEFKDTPPPAPSELHRKSKQSSTRNTTADLPHDCMHARRARTRVLMRQECAHGWHIRPHL
eukprot:497563-Prymnesium_polylepis.1